MFAVTEGEVRVKRADFSALSPISGLAGNPYLLRVPKIAVAYLAFEWHNSCSKNKEQLS